MTKNQQTAVSGLHLPDIPLDALLSFLKDTRGTVNWSVKSLKDCLRLDAKQAQQILAILEMQGYIAREGDQWLTTTAGEAVSKSKRPQFSLKSVTEALDAIKERMATLNRDKRSEFRIMKAVAFGDFLSGRTRVQAADLGVELSLRTLIGDEDLNARRKQFMYELSRKSRLLSVRTYHSWMSLRSHQDLI